MYVTCKMNISVEEVGQTWDFTVQCKQISIYAFVSQVQMIIDCINKQAILLFQNFAENTMNELLGWYGYDKVELKDGEDIEFRNYPPDGESRQHISVLKGNGI